MLRCLAPELTVLLVAVDELDAHHVHERSLILPTLCDRPGEREEVTQIAQGGRASGYDEEIRPVMQRQ
ncbi:hypothetical protein JJB11_10875 [Ramlibacter ginsenosidimutans]|uniref:Uncharacterized protein n=1 Tax=Ramlibacter ginsenosidimutans TaxID=502333 RepID=A0A934TS51_9BURK|nr:hypothetical protein [Ramlibacter ginsenosidimutans]